MYFDFIDYSRNLLLNITQKTLVLMNQGPTWKVPPQNSFSV